MDSALEDNKSDLRPIESDDTYVKITSLHLNYT